MIPEPLRDSLRSAWSINDSATRFLFERLPDIVWTATVPGVPHRTVRTIGAHLHNNRCSWIRSMGKPIGVAVPDRVDHRNVTRRQLIAALKRSHRRMLDVIEAGFARDGRIPAAAWQNFPPDVVHWVAYHVAHEAHHRGQIVMLARQLGHRLPAEVTNGVWQWSRLARDV